MQEPIPILIIETSSTKPNFKTKPKLKHIIGSTYRLCVSVCLKQNLNQKPMFQLLHQSIFKRVET